MPKFRYIGNHVAEVYSGDKCIMLAPGEFVDLTAEDQKGEHTKEAIDNGLLIPAGSKGGT